MQFTNGFSWSGSLAMHFRKKGPTVGATTEAEYLALADNFVGGPLPPGTLECMRSDGDQVRYNPNTDEFGVLDTLTGVIRTYWRLQGTRAQNLAYFQANCLRTWP